MRRWARQFHVACTAVEAPIRQRAFAVLIAITVLVDLCAYELPRFLLWEERQFHMPWLPVWPDLRPTAGNTFLLYGATALACMGANALFWGRRWGAWLVFVVYAYAYLDHQPSYTNNGYLLLWLLCVLGGSELRGTAHAWPRRCGQVTLSAMYAAAGFSKLDPVFLSGSVLGQALTRYSARYEAWVGVDSPGLFRVVSWATCALELALAIGLWFPRARRLVIPLGIALHVGIEALMPVRFFSFLCLSGYTLFVEPTLLTDVAQRLRRLAQPALWLAAAVMVLALLELPWYGVALPSALIVACSIGVGAALWGRPRPADPARGACAPSRHGAVLVGGVIALHALCAVKPLLGYSKRFAWQMFSEVLIMRVETQVRLDGHYRRARFPGAEARWREDGYRHHWTSWGEERIYLAGYAEWLAATYALSKVRVIAHYRRNGAPEARAVFESGL